MAIQHGNWLRWTSVVVSNLALGLFLVSPALAAHPGPVAHNLPTHSHTHTSPTHPHTTLSQHRLPPHTHNPTHGNAQSNTPHGPTHPTHPHVVHGTGGPQ